jgi:hypothetical protein
MTKKKTMNFGSNFAYQKIQKPQRMRSGASGAGGWLEFASSLKILAPQGRHDKVYCYGARNNCFSIFLAFST